MVSRIVTLTTDFGTADSYAAAMKGVILSINPAARLVDLSHELAPHDVVGAALFLADAIRYFPEGTVHLAVVDPGVGTERRAICVRTARSYYVAPDNGVVSLAVRAEQPYETVVLTNTDYHLGERSSATFHGRDIFAPVAAHLSLEIDFHDLGPPAAELVELEMPPVNEPSPGMIDGEIVHVDRFGNLMTNISRQTLLDARQKTGITDQPVVVDVEGTRISGLSRTYGDRAPGELIALWGSTDYLEISVVQGSAADRLGLRPGAPVHIR